MLDTGTVAVNTKNFVAWAFFCPRITAIHCYRPNPAAPLCTCVACLNTLGWGLNVDIKVIYIAVKHYLFFSFLTLAAGIAKESFKSCIVVILPGSHSVIVTSAFRWRTTKFRDSFSFLTRKT